MNTSISTNMKENRRSSEGPHPRHRSLLFAESSLVNLRKKVLLTDDVHPYVAIPRSFASPPAQEFINVPEKWIPGKRWSANAKWGEKTHKSPGAVSGISTMEKETRGLFRHPRKCHWPLGEGFLLFFPCLCFLSARKVNSPREIQKRDCGRACETKVRWLYIFPAIFSAAIATRNGGGFIGKLNLRNARRRTGAGQKHRRSWRRIAVPLCKFINRRKKSVGVCCSFGSFAETVVRIRFVSLVKVGYR